jgi:DNA topoisomerase-1
LSIRSHLLATGIRRFGAPRNTFRYRRADGRRASPADARRLDALRIPRAWTSVHIATSPRAKVQAVGRDAAGRWQYLYRAAYARRRSHARFDLLVAFGDALPALRRTLARDLARRGMPREKALACAVALLSACLLRPGTEIYAAENRTFGLATLRDRHVAIAGGTIRLDFRGKHGRRQRHELRDARLARIVAAMKQLPGIEVFKFVDAQGRVRDLRAEHVNRYLRRAMGAPFSARVFRNWGGTLVFARELARAARRTPAALLQTAQGHTLRRAAAAAALRATAAQLGNTVAVCRRSYVHPGVLAAFARGRTVPATSTRTGVPTSSARTGLDRAERALLSLLRGKRPTRA